jgi:hypothetical protein
MRVHASFRVGLVATTVLGLAPACAVTRDFIYRPSAPAIADVEGLPAAVYPVPPERPEAEVRVASVGVSYLQTAPGPTSLPTLQVRMVIANNGDAAGLTLDTTQVLVDIPGEGTAAPMYANSAEGAMPVVTVARGERKVVDLYFPLPATTASADRLAAFDLEWQVQTGARRVAERTPFQRLELESRRGPPPPVVFVAGWGPFWWYHPHYPHRHPFIHAPLMVVPPARHRVILVRPARSSHVSPARPVPGPRPR